MNVLDPFISGEPRGCEGLLRTIKVPTNIRHVNLPNSTYGRKVEIVKPLEQRIHVTKGFKTELACVNSPDLQTIADLELWSPTIQEEPLAAEIEQDMARASSNPSPDGLVRISHPAAPSARNPRFRPKLH
jgi:hypothetical protein